MDVINLFSWKPHWQLLLAGALFGNCTSQQAAFLHLLSNISIKAVLSWP